MMFNSRFLCLYVFNLVELETQIKIIIQLKGFFQGVGGAFAPTLGFLA